MRIHVWLAKQMNVSRREAEKWVLSGEVRVDGVIAKVGHKLEGSERIMVRGRTVDFQHVQPKLLALHKPVGYECSQKPQSGLSVFELLPVLKTGKWILVGRLDLNTSGLLLVSTDGQLANELSHPSKGFKREYLVRVNGEISPKNMQALKNGIALEDGMAKCDGVKIHKRSQGVNHWYQITMSEGRNRIVRRLMSAVGLEVSRLVRVRFGPVKLEKALGVGKTQEVDIEWIKRFMSS